MLYYFEIFRTVTTFVHDMHISILQKIANIIKFHYSTIPLHRPALVSLEPNKSQTTRKQLFSMLKRYSSRLRKKDEEVDHSKEYQKTVATVGVTYSVG